MLHPTWKFVYSGFFPATPSASPSPPKSPGAPPSDANPADFSAVTAMAAPPQCPVASHVKPSRLKAAIAMVVPSNQSRIQRRIDGTTSSPPHEPIVVHSDSGSEDSILQKDFHAKSSVHSSSRSQRTCIRKSNESVHSPIQPPKAKESVHLSTRRLGSKVTTRKKSISISSSSSSSSVGSVSSRRDKRASVPKVAAPAADAAAIPPLLHLLGTSFKARDSQAAKTWLLSHFADIHMGGHPRCLNSRYSRCQFVWIHHMVTVQQVQLRVRRVQGLRCQVCCSVAAGFSMACHQSSRLSALRVVSCPPIATTGSCSCTSNG